MTSAMLYPRKGTEGQWIAGSMERGNLKNRVTLVLVIRERRHKMTWAMAVSEKRN